jgi:AraC-like DNA-binding protein
MTMEHQFYSNLIRARALTGFTSLVEEHGGDPMALLATVGIPASALEEPDSTIPLDRLARLHDLAARTLKLPDFGLRLSTRQDISVLGPIASIALHSGTIGEALASLSRYFSYHSPGGRIDVESEVDPDFLSVRYALNLGPLVPRRQIMELSYAVAWKFWAMLVPAEAGNAHIQLRHSRALDESVYRRYFGCPLSFDQPIDAINVPRMAINIKIDRANSKLRGVVEQFVSNIVRRYPVDIGQQVGNLVVQQLTTGGATIEGIAEQLSMHKRTLQRRLGAHGLHFEKIVDDIRCSQAIQYLSYEAIPLTQIGALLGYDEQSSFVRACRRWFGATPQAVRNSSALEKFHSLHQP